MRGNFLSYVLSLGVLMQPLSSFAVISGIDSNEGKQSLQFQSNQEVDLDETEFEPELRQELIESYGCDLSAGQGCIDQIQEAVYSEQGFDLKSLLWNANFKNEKLFIVIDKAAKVQQMVVFNESRTYVRRWLVSTGMELSEPVVTPSGSTTHKRTPRVTNLNPTVLSKYHKSRTWDGADMPFAIFFYGGVAIHSAHLDYKIKLLGSRASGGCIRLLPINAEELYDKVEKEYGKKNTFISVIDSSRSDGGQLPEVGVKLAIRHDLGEAADVKRYGKPGKKNSTNSAEAIPDQGSANDVALTEGQIFTENGKQYMVVGGQPVELGTSDSGADLYGGVTILPPVKQNNSSATTTPADRSTKKKPKKRKLGDKIVDFFSGGGLY